MYSSTLVAQSSLRAEHVVVMLGEPVRLVANVLEQTKGERPAAEDDRVGAAGHVDLFLALGQRDHGRRVDLQRLERRQSRAELAFAAVDQEDIRKWLVALLQTLDPAA